MPETIIIKYIEIEKQVVKVVASLNTRFLVCFLPAARQGRCP